MTAPALPAPSAPIENAGKFYNATEQHIGFLADKRARLHERQREAEEQLVLTLARDLAAGHIDLVELQTVYERLRGPGKNPQWTPGFPTKIWAAYLPDIRTLKSEIIRAERERSWRQAYISSPQTWSGFVDFTISRTTHSDDYISVNIEGVWLDRSEVPPDGYNVAYVLHDESGTPCYVGSTNRFYARLRTHAYRGKKWQRWQAYKCDSREAAYQLEERFLDRWMPFLNGRRGR